jgi:two-component system chemotaxis response regulator CheY
MEENKRKILIVDDDAFLLDMYAFKFSQNNFEVYTAGDGLQAIAKLKDGLNPEVLLMDLIMPEMDGFEMLEKINKENLSPNSTKIILSNKSQQSDIDRGNALGVSGYIVKANSTPSEVIEQVVGILSKKAVK